MTEWVANLGLWWYILFYLGVQLVNVVLNTLKTIITARASKIPAAIINSLTFGFYTLVVALTADMSNLWVNMVITVVANLIGVYYSIWLLEKLRKDKLWEITATIKENFIEIAKNSLSNEKIPFTCIQDSTRHYILHIYSSSQRQSEIIKIILINCQAKYIVHQEEVRL